MTVTPGSDLQLIHGYRNQQLRAEASSLILIVH